MDVLIEMTSFWAKRRIPGGCMAKAGSGRRELPEMFNEISAIGTDRHPFEINLLAFCRCSAS
ncbi:hypothetical protein [Frigidibacter sp. MR17.24]|uniref:hypothetical protein n=1 Tax=Frigidibacter sp. MR17.24 TaxID=3127345 RepID=UPI003012A219